MSSTITTGRRAGVAIAKNGKRYYALVETSYESNCYPHHPHECCIGLFPLREAVANVIRWSAAIPGGCLKGRGRLSVAGYVKSWLHALAHPQPVDEIAKTVKVGNGLYEVQPDRVKQAVSRLCAIGYNSKANDLEHGSLALRLNEDAAAIAAVGVPPGIAPWKFINPEDVFGDAVDDEGIHLPPVGRETPVPELYVVDTGIKAYVTQPVVTAYAAATPYMPEFHCTGQRYRVIESWLCHLAGSIEALPDDMPERTAGRFMAAMVKAAYAAETTVKAELRMLPDDFDVSVDCTPHSDFEAQHMHNELTGLQRSLDPVATSLGTVATTLGRYKVRAGNGASMWAERVAPRFPSEVADIAKSVVDINVLAA
ncbi:MAG TPA: hypothetical protein VF292_02845 [Rhodanobacteraceae bacterium]